MPEFPIGKLATALVLASLLALVLGFIGEWLWQCRPRKE